ncbi:hypothetical protein PILCRDRAFT_811436 [Piloderma croceum F 1598]|uniref:Folylpolyglutamate synthase n=1 Tax=Piloderma croceum (strain F 1598) TaxID=765440 RepID=A0A0C3BWL6_PILCF|nr:hypothetical protein PILCRDRAFT_811436 [Piloderma croceum F 1598]
MSTRTYSDAIECLNSLQSNKATLDAVKATGGRLNDLAIPEMVEYWERIHNHTRDELNTLNVIHITGTKGKGSASAFTSSILCHVKPEWKIGLYTSPHMVSVRERIRINGTPLSEEVFAKFFFEVWDALDANTQRKNPNTPVRPMYFRFMTLVAFHAFIKLKVNATVLEVGVGGTYDSTNIVPRPVVTGITSLGFDHQGVLGNTLGEIASQKAGIFKEGVPALTVSQPEEGLKSLRKRAKELELHLIEVPSTGFSEIKLGLAGTHQASNASLAVKLAQIFLRQKASIEPEYPLPKSYIDGLQNVRWPGRCQTVPDPGHRRITWFLDGAHTPESLDCCMQWFVSPGVGLTLQPSPRRPIRALIFNITHGRSGNSFLAAMQTAQATQLKIYGRDEDSQTFFDHVIFCTNVTYVSGSWKKDLTAVSTSEQELAQLKTQKELASAWSEQNPSFPQSSIHIVPTIEHAVNVVRGLESESNDTDVSVLVTGSLHLVGGLIEAASLSDIAL